MPCCQTPPRTRSTTERDDLDRTDAIPPYLIFIYAWSGRRPMNNSANQSSQTELFRGDSRIVPQFRGQILVKGDQRRLVSDACGGNSATFSLWGKSSVPIAQFTFHRA